MVSEKNKRKKINSMKKIIKMLWFPFTLIIGLYEAGLSNQDYKPLKKKISEYFNS